MWTGHTALAVQPANRTVEGPSLHSTRFLPAGGGKTEVERWFYARPLGCSSPHPCDFLIHGTSATRSPGHKPEPPPTSPLRHPLPVCPVCLPITAPYPLLHNLHCPSPPPPSLIPSFNSSSAFLPISSPPCPAFHPTHPANPTPERGRRIPLLEH